MGTVGVDADAGQRSGGRPMTRYIGGSPVAASVRPELAERLTNPPLSEREKEAATVYASISSYKPFGSQGNLGVSLRATPLLCASNDELVALSIDCTLLEIVAQLDGTATVADILAHTPAPHSEVLGILWDLLDAGFITLVEAMPTSVAMARCA